MYYTELKKCFCKFVINCQIPIQCLYVSVKVQEREELFLGKTSKAFWPDVLHAAFRCGKLWRSKTVKKRLRWPNTVFARAFADAIQQVHKDCKKQTFHQQSDHLIYSTLALSVLFFSIIERSLLMALVFCYKDVLEKVTMQRTQQFSTFSLLLKVPS